MKISIITVSYNSENHIQSTIESVLHQTYPDIEYIIVDGNSRDRTIEIVKSYEPVFAGRLRWISEPDRGMYDAMNKGIRMATGEIVGMLNSDDFFTGNQVVSEIVKTFRTVTCDAVYGDVHYVHSADLTKCVRYYSSSVFHRNLMFIGLMPAHPTFYIYKHHYDNFGYYNMEYQIAADFEWLLRLIYIHKIKTKYLFLDCVTMRVGGMSNATLNSRKTIMKEHLRAFKENGIANNRVILSLRYPYKIYELLRSKLQQFK